MQRRKSKNCRRDRTWNASLYDQKHEFVSEYGKGLLEFIPDHKEQFPNIEFRICDALALPYEKEWDVVLSNAVFHWIDDHGALLKNIHKALKPKGLLVCEFGAKGNIATIEGAFAKACKEFGYGYQFKFNFPAAEDFGRLLENHGFLIDRIYEYDRPTILDDAEQGLVNWMIQFFASELSEMPEEVRSVVLKRVEELTRDTLWNGEAWVQFRCKTQQNAESGSSSFLAGRDARPDP